MNILELIAAILISGPVGYLVGVYDAKSVFQESKTAAYVALGTGTVMLTIAITARVVG